MMRIKLIPVAFFLVLLPILSPPAFTTGKSLTGFEGGAGALELRLDESDLRARFNITLPGKCFVVNATFGIRTGPTRGNDSGPLMNPILRLDGDILWAFNGTGHGGFGWQDGFLNGTSVCMEFTTGGGADEALLRMPRGAVVQNANLSLLCGEENQPAPIMTSEGSNHFHHLGQSVAIAGDLNADGIDDLAIGQGPYHPENERFKGDNARVHFGGRTMNRTADLAIPHSGGFDDFHPVAGAGDYNADGHDDLLIGSPRNSSGIGTVMLFGGPDLDNVTDLEFHDAEMGLGAAVSGIGDVNADGHADIALYHQGRGQVFVYFGGADADGTPEVILNVTPAGRTDIVSVAGAGDVNGDGHDDLIVGACDSLQGWGMAAIHYGGTVMNTTPDLYLNHTGQEEQFGCSVASAGDLDRDGFSDVIVGAPLNGTRRGAAFIFLGGSTMDSEADITLNGTDEGGYLGSSISTAGDLDRDGIDDIVVGAPGWWDATNATSTGKVHLFFSGLMSDAGARRVIDDGGTFSCFGCAVSGGGDLNADGFGDIVAGANFDSVGWNQGGRTTVFDGNSFYPGLKAVELKVGRVSAWSNAGFSAGRIEVEDLSDILNTHLREASVSSTDSHGIDFVDVPVTVEIKNAGAVVLAQVNITYDLECSVPDFADELNSYLADHRNSTSPDGNLSIPLHISSDTPGQVTLSSCNITVDEPPVLARPIPDIAMDEDSSMEALVDLRDHFEDGSDGPADLRFSISSATNEDKVFLGITPEGHLSADALSGAENDNWTGVVSVRVAARDGRGLETVSNEFRLTVRNVNDPPLITSSPPTTAVGQARYAYNITAIDGDGDTLTYGLVRFPEGMAVDAARGVVQWTPELRQAGDAPVAIRVSDGHGGENLQEYVIRVLDDGQRRPKCRITFPTENARIRGNVLVRGEAFTPGPPLTRVEIRIDGKGWVTVLGTENWSRALDTTALGEGGHVLEARSWAGDIVSEVQSVNFTVANPPPLKVVVDPAWQAGAILLALLAVGSIVLLARVRRN